MDYGNALMYGVNASIVSKLQRVHGVLLHTEGLVEKKNS
jgi:hypothetical protein